MTLSRASVEGLAALCGAIPDLAFAVTTTSGVVLAVAERPDAALCPHTFRRAVLSWPECPDHAPCIEDVAFESFDESAGILSSAGERWFVSPLNAQDTAACLGTSVGIDSTIDALVREDLEFDVSVVRLSMSEPNEAVLTDAAIAGYAACLTEELVREASTHAA